MFASGLPIPIINEGSNDYRQSNDNNDSYNGNYKYTTLINRSPSNMSSNTALGEDEDSLNKNGLNVDGKSGKMVKSNSDQKIPENSDKNKQASYFYVNKNGFPVHSHVTSPKHFGDDLKKDKTNPEKNTVICTDLLLEVYKSNKETLTSDSNKLNSERSNFLNQDRQSVGRSVPNLDNQSLSSLNLSSNNSLVQRDTNGNVIINTNLTIQEPNIDFNSDHVKYINLFSILCCWCFPITGIISIIFARLTKKYYDLRDIAKAKKYLNRAEWMLILTFFFGCTLIAIAFAMMEAFWLKTGSNNSNLRVDGGIFHTRSLPK